VAHRGEGVVIAANRERAETLLLGEELDAEHDRGSGYAETSEENLQAKGHWCGEPRKGDYSTFTKICIFG
jgi:hypothetical protein